MDPRQGAGQALERCASCLAALRSGLRDRMRRSPLLDAQGFTRKVETAFQGMWLEWCKRQGTVG